MHNTTAISRYQLPPPFVPYFYAGGPERGVAVFADSDKDCESLLVALQSNECLFRVFAAGWPRYKQIQLGAVVVRRDRSGAGDPAPPQHHQRFNP